MTRTRSPIIESSCGWAKFVDGQNRETSGSHPCPVPGRRRTKSTAGLVATFQYDTLVCVNEKQFNHRLTIELSAGAVNGTLASQIQAVYLSLKSKMRKINLTAPKS